MATLTIRNLPDDVRDKLRVRAAQNGRSMEAEARAVLELELAPQPAAITPEEQKQRVRRAQKAMRPYQVPGLLASEELIADRRLEAWKETVETMHEIRKRGGPMDAEEILRNASNARRRP